jgi:hypothetical protein
MTEFATIESQDSKAIGFTANTVTEPSVEAIDAWKRRYTSGLFIKELADKATEFQALSKRTDAYLYALLQDCYDDFQILNEPSSNLASNAKEALDKLCNKMDIKVTSETTLLIQFLKCVFFGADRSKISTYGSVIKYAIKQKIAKGTLAEEIERVGGIQKIKIASFSDAVQKAKDKSAENLLKAQTEVEQISMGVVDIPMAMGAISTLKTGAQVVLIASINADRKFVIRAATSEPSVIRSAVLAANKPKKAIEQVTDADNTDVTASHAAEEELQAA